MAHLEADYILSPTQSGYGKHRSTEDQLELLAQEKKYRMPPRRRKRLAVFYDLSKAFDKVWREGLLLKVFQAGVSGRMYK